MRNLVAALFAMMLMASVPAFGQEAGPFMETPRLIEVCSKGYRADDSAARAVCDSYLMGVFDSARTIQRETRKATGNSEFMVLCNPGFRPRLADLGGWILEHARNEPDSVEVDPAVFVIRTLNVPSSCK